MAKQSMEADGVDDPLAAPMGAAVAAGVATIAPMVRVASRRVLGIPDPIMGLVEDYFALKLGSDAVGLSLEELTQEAKEFLIEKGTNADFGARPLRRAIEQHVEDPLSEEILRGAFKGKDLIRITVKGEGETKHLFFDAVTTGNPEEQQLAKAASDAT